MDAHGSTRHRLPLLTPAALTAAQQQVYAAITRGPRSKSSALLDPEGRLEGPFNAMLYSPSIGDAVQALGASIRYTSSLTDRERELATLRVAALEQSNFEWLAHESIARTAGLTARELELLATTPVADVSGFTPSEAAIVRYVEALVGTQDVADPLYFDTIEALGSGKVVELTYLVGYYRMLALSLRVFRVELPAGVSGRWPSDATG